MKEYVAICEENSWQKNSLVLSNICCVMCPWMSYILGRGMVFLWLSVCCYVGDFPSWASTKCHRILKINLHSSLVFFWCCKGQKAQQGGQHCSEADAVKNCLGLNGLQNIRYYPVFCRTKCTGKLGLHCQEEGKSKTTSSAFSWPSLFHYFTMKKAFFGCILQDYIASHYAWWLHLDTKLCWEYIWSIRR